MMLHAFSVVIRTELSVTAVKLQPSNYLPTKMKLHWWDRVLSWAEDSMLKWHSVNTVCDHSIFPESQGLYISFLLLLLFFFYISFTPETSTTDNSTDGTTRLSVYLLSVLNKKHTWHKWSVSTDLTKTKEKMICLLGVECCHNCMIVKTYIAILNYLIFVIFEATVAVWQKCLKSISFLKKLEVFF